MEVRCCGWAEVADQYCGSGAEEEQLENQQKAAVHRICVLKFHPRSGSLPGEAAVEVQVLELPEQVWMREQEGLCERTCLHQPVVGAH